MLCSEFISEGYQTNGKPAFGNFELPDCHKYWFCFGKTNLIIPLKKILVNVKGIYSVHARKMENRELKMFVCE